MSKVFIDTNVLIYSVDAAAGRKRNRALDLVDTHARARTGVISTQVLQEFYSAATRKLGIAPLDVKQHIRDFHLFDIIQVTPALIEDGIDCSILNQVSFWDALVVTTAATSGCSELLSEDLNAGQTIQGVTVTDPFN